MGHSIRAKAERSHDRVSFAPVQVHQATLSRGSTLFETHSNFRSAPLFPIVHVARRPDPSSCAIYSRLCGLLAPMFRGTYREYKTLLPVVNADQPFVTSGHLTDCLKFCLFDSSWVAGTPLHFERRKAVESSFRGPIVSFHTHEPLVQTFGNSYNRASLVLFLLC
jgi:hypothetical protein